MLDRAKSVFPRYPNNEAGGMMAVLEFLAAQGVPLGPFRLSTQSKHYFSEGSRRFPKVKLIYLVTEKPIEPIEWLLRNHKSSPVKVTGEGTFIWNGWLEFEFRSSREDTRGRESRVVVEYGSKIARKPQQPDTVTFGFWGKVTGIHPTNHYGMLAVMLCVTCGLALLYYLVQLSLPYSPPKSNWQKFLEGCKALFGY
ncbi:uncharacterized protein BO66DRAFT_403803 [Aspergillus aculeatinus CBS 121060]|uniref:Uncharacterized protein n=1 Tax=Aspergillus aculeatinus CBS 121060 TaxID=1448322 RepID=A0ACD1H230_9EURO|nr:hypothetical protein BO66DRAFT_403803 [Aspergillus aculeatinus CBS 121060]RAH67615.1 hypothetical protein BO66DRAFT_403803 [Aspergillus aculeatinus CBS 121060]